MGLCYLDNSATTAVCKAAADKAYAMMTETFGNPSSLHTLGIRAETEITAAREAVADLIGARADEILFTSGGTEANNLAIIGGSTARVRVGKHIVITAVEHSSSAAAAAALEQQGYTVTRVMPDADGDITAEQMLAACRDDTVLVSMMLVNNETGAIFPVGETAAALAKRFPNARMHCDAVQAVGKLAVNVKRLGVHFLTVSAHKLHAPKGCGALYIRKGERVRPLICGGEQEKGVRGGTEAAPLIAAFGAAIGELPPIPAHAAHMQALCDRLTAALGGVEGIVFHRPKRHLPAIVNFSVVGYRSETMLHYLASKEIYVSSGSACAKGKPSEVLTAMGLPKREADSALRISFSRDNTEQDVDRLVDAIHEGMARLAHTR